MHALPQAPTFSGAQRVAAIIGPVRVHAAEKLGTKEHQWLA
jgi:hypothetical protein